MALRPRWLGLLALVLLIVAAFGWLGMWQLNVARDTSRREALERAAATPVASIGQVLPASTPLTAGLVGRTVSATGTYDAAHQLIVTPRQLHGQAGCWVMTPLIVDGAALPVVRGWVADPAQAQPPPSGQVTVTGALAPPESAPGAPVALPAGQVATIDLARLVNEWDMPTYSAFIYLAAETPPAAWTPAVVPSPAGVPEGIAWRNLAYAAQWWLFAAFAVYMWVRMVRDDAAGAPGQPADPARGGTSA